jgi:hypothetical protein
MMCPVDRVWVHLLGCAAVLAAALDVAPARGQNPEVVATYLRADPKAPFAFKWKEKGDHTRTAALLHWSVPPSEFGTAGLDRDFRTFCAEALVGIVAGRTYRFRLEDPATPGGFGLPDTDEGRAQALRRATYVRELFGRYYVEARDPANPESALAFQTALWEIIHESELPDDPTPFGLFTGNFQAAYPNLGQSPVFVQRAQDYLASLTGSDLVFYQNPNLAGLELVRMAGLASPTGEVGQSQFALRYAVGGAPGFNGATGGVPIGGVGLAGAPFSPIGGLGGPGGFGVPLGGFGGTGGFAGVPGGGGTGTPPAGGTTTPPGVVPNVPVSNIPPSVSRPAPPPGPGLGIPPVGGPPTEQQPPTNPPGVIPDVIPAPPGVLLGLLAVGLLAGRRVLIRLTHKG